MSLIIPANSAASGGFAVDNSCRFNSGSSDNLEKTFGSAGNQKTYTLSCWVKRTSLSSHQRFFGWKSGGGGYGLIWEGSDRYDALRAYIVATGSNAEFLTNRLFRDVSAWYHIVLAVDTTQGTASNRIKLYVNGVEETSFSSITYPNLNEDTSINIADNCNIGVNPVADNSFLNGYMSEVCFIDGSALAPTDFGEFDEDSGIWKPIDVSGLTFGTNGFYLDFENSGALGADVSGNTNNFTVNNLTAIDQTTDTPTNNFATLNPLKFSGGTFSEGNLKFTGIASNWKNRYSTIGVSSGKWFMEFKMGSITADQSGVAIVSDITPDGNFPAVDSTRVPAIAYNSDGNKYVNATASSGYFSAMSTNDIIGIALDMDNGTVQFYRNGSTTGSAIDLSDGFSTSQYPLFFCGAVYSTRDTQANFGNPTFTGTDQSDGNSRGSFEYAPPSGYLSLCTANLSEVLG